jgi:hypothetical protein
MASGKAVVSLKAPVAPKGPAIRLFRSDDGFSFSVGHVDASGTTDWRTETLHCSFDEAAKQAQSKSHQFRLPIINDTGVDIVEKAAPGRQSAQTKSAVTKATKAKSRQTSKELWEKIKSLPPLFAAFELPDVENGAARIDDNLFTDHAFDRFKALQAEAAEVHDSVFGDSRDYPCSYSQRTHDTLNGQMRLLFSEILMQRAVICGYLELAFARIDQLQSSDKGLSYAGVWKPGIYGKGQFATHQGSMWHCNRTTQRKPGDDADDWTLAVKRGRDGKDAANAA